MGCDYPLNNIEWLRMPINGTTMDNNKLCGNACVGNRHCNYWVYNPEKCVVLTLYLSTLIFIEFEEGQSLMVSNVLNIAEEAGNATCTTLLCRLWASLTIQYCSTGSHNPLPIFYSILTV